MHRHPRILVLWLCVACSQIDFPLADPFLCRAPRSSQMLLLMLRWLERLQNSQCCVQLLNLMYKISKHLIQVSSLSFLRA